MEPTSDELDTVKKRKEIEKLEVDIGNAKATLGLERFKTWAALLGPVMTALTVLGTVYIGYLQISAKSESDEDANWRQTLNSINEVKPEDFGTKHVATLLRPFLSSKRYRTLAIGVTVDELPKVRDLGTFKDLFNAVFPQPGVDDLPIILDLDRRLKAVIYGLFSSIGPNKENKPQATDAYDLVRTESSVLCEPISTIIKHNSAEALGHKFPSSKNREYKIPMNDIYFESCDFSDMDFSNVDLTNSAFDWVKLDNSVLNIDSNNPYLWDSIIWWNAKEIDPVLLKSLISQFKPYAIHKDLSATVSYRDQAVIDPSDWERNVRRLCASAHLTCTDEQIHAEFPKGP